MSKTARVTYTGTVTFNYKGHGIKLTATDPEIEIAGGASRGIFVTANTGDRGQARRADQARPGRRDDGPQPRRHQPRLHADPGLDPG